MYYSSPWSVVVLAIIDNHGHFHIKFPAINFNTNYVLSSMKHTVRAKDTNYLVIISQSYRQVVAGNFLAILQWKNNYKRRKDVFLQLATNLLSGLHRNEALPFRRHHRARWRAEHSNFPLTHIKQRMNIHRGFPRSVFESRWRKRARERSSPKTNARNL